MSKILNARSTASRVSGIGLNMDTISNYQDESASLDFAEEMEY